MNNTLAYTLLFAHFNKYTRMAHEDFEKCKRFFSIENHRAHSSLIKRGATVTKQYFVAQGCLRTYLTDLEKNREYTIQFAVEEWWASDYISYYTGAPSELFVECIEDCTLLSIEKYDLERLYAQVPQLELFFLRKLENAFVAFQKRILANLKNSAEDRYADFLKQYPDIEQRVKNYQIASYLGITPESLSRIRKARD